jgi:hypothetical protein
MATNSAAGVAEEKVSLASLAPSLKFIQVATGTDDASIMWPCVEFKNFACITPDVKKTLHITFQESAALGVSFMQYMRRRKSNEGVEVLNGPVALLLGKTVPNQTRCIWFQGELLNFLDNLAVAYVANGDTVPTGFDDAMHAAWPMIEAVSCEENTESTSKASLVALSSPKHSQTAASTGAESQISGPFLAVAAKESNTAAVGSRSDASATFETNATANPPDQGNEIEAPSTVPGTSSNDVKAIAPNEASVESESDAVPITTKTRASSSKCPKNTKAARPSMDVALSAEETLSSAQNSPMADATTTPRMSTRRTKPPSGSKRKTLQIVASSGKKQAVTPANSKKAKTTGSPDHVIPSFQDVRKSLEKGGYIFRDGIYCRPGMDPEKNKMAQLAEDWFQGEQTFREHLCAYGVDGDRNTWTDEDEVLIKNWVRYTVVKSINGEGVIPDFDELSGGKAGSLLRKIGMTHGTLKNGDNGIFLPGVTKSEGVLGVNCFPTRLFEGQPGIWAYLARFGLPDNCRFTEVSEKDVLNLELYVCSHKIETL